MKVAVENRKVFVYLTRYKDTHPSSVR